MLLHNEIRILDLLPAPQGGGDDVPIVCTLRVENLSPQLDFEAISYVWGDQRSMVNIDIQGGQIGVTESVRALLKRLRLADRKRALWIDQLCIEQQNLEDKRQQMQLMRDIYRSCRRCLAWLGEIRQDIPRKDAEAAWELVRYMAAAAAADQGTDPEGRRRVPGCGTDGLPTMDGVMRALESVVEGGNPWWSRMWTVQEAALPKELTLHWGPLTLSWRDLMGAARCWTHIGIPPALQHLMDNHHRKVLSQLITHSIWLNGATSMKEPTGLIHQWRWRQATDPRDKIFGILGLCQPGSLPVTEQCDYTIPARGVFSTLTIELILGERDLRPLIMNPRIEADRATPGLPSWAMDLASTGPRYGVDGFYHLFGYRQYDACRGLEPLDATALQMQLGVQTLKLAGVHIDSVASADEGHRTDQVWDWEVPMDRVLDRWHDTAMREAGVTAEDAVLEPYPGGYPRSEAFARFMLGDLIREIGQRPLRMPTEDDIRQFWALKETRRTTDEVRRTVYGMLANRNLFITETGLMGCGHLDTQPGDEVWVFRGGRVPFIVRPSAVEGSTRYTFVGQAYVQGVMQGEALTDSRLSTGGEQIIELY